MKMNKVPVHFNAKQIQLQLANCNETYLVAGRAFGKTTGVAAPWLIEGVEAFPKGGTGIVANSFIQVLTKTLPPLITMWNKMGYQENIHYRIGKPFPTHFPQPLQPPKDSKYIIYWFNGHYQLLISQETKASANGVSLQQLFGDEAKFLNYERIQNEIYPAMRGHRDVFGKHHRYMAKLFITDMPTDPRGDWILTKKQQCQPEVIETIIQLQLQLQKYQLAQSIKPAYQTKKINELNKVLTALRKNNIHYMEASALDNAEVLGDSYFRDMKRNLTEIQYKTSILNQRIISVESCFYSTYDPEKHGYYATNDEKLEKVFQQSKEELKRYEHSSLYDLDIDPTKPLEVAFDYGKNINGLVVGQRVTPKLYRVVKSMFVLDQGVAQLIAEFCAYYKSHKNKTIHYFYDHTSKQEDKHALNYTYAASVIQEFKKQGWTVKEIYIGHTPRHNDRYLFFERLFEQELSTTVKINREQASSLEESMMLCELEIDHQGRRKNKKPEKNPYFPQEKAPHLSDAFDTLIYPQVTQSLQIDAIDTVQL